MRQRFIYKATNLINDKSYIGKTINFKSRKAGHLETAKNGIGCYFHDAIRKHGSKNFKWTILYHKICTNNHINYAEKFFIAYYETQFPNGYNLTEGGDGSWECLKTHPRKEEIYKTRSITLRKTLNNINSKTGLKRSQEISQKAANTMNKINPKTGLTKYQEIGKKISKTLKETHEKYGYWWTGKHHTKETKSKISKSQQGKHLGSKNSQHGKMWIYNLELKQSIRIDKNDEIPEGWLKGRKMRFLNII